MAVTSIVRSAPQLKTRFQLLGGLIFSVILPLSVRYFFLSPSEDIYPLYVSAAGSLVALILASWMLRNITTYPGAEASSYVIPAVSISFATLFIALILGRIPYNRAMLVSAWVISVIWHVTIQARNQSGRKMRIGVVPPCDASALAGIETVEAVSLVEARVGEVSVDAVMADLRADIPAKWDAALADYALAGIPVYHLKHLRESLTGRVELEHLSENNFGSLSPLSAFMIFKRFFDFLTALIAAILLLPMLVLVAVVIRASSAGPILFRQQRIGYQGKPFTVYKFRTMKVEKIVEAARDAAMTRDQDLRITQVGHFLRRTRIDELPQIINIVRGEMSWIGPRPEAEILSKWYEQEISFYRYRHIVLPGVTGWAQINQGHVTAVSEVKEKLYYDFYYIKNFSLWIDLLIINRTARIILSGFGAR